MSTLTKTKYFTPSPAIGDIYIVISYRVTAFGISKPTLATVKWGRWNKSETIAPDKIGLTHTLGFVLKLKHTKNDSVRLSILTNGNFKKEIYQGNPPTEWISSSFKNIEW